MRVQQGMIEVHVRLPVSKAKAPDMLRALTQIMVSAQIDRGCDHAEVTQEAKDSSVLIYVEDWADREQLNRRIQSDRFGTLLGLMEACREMPSLEVRFVSEVRGLDYVAAVRQA